MFILMLSGFLIALNPPDLIVKLSILSIVGTAILGPTYIGAVIFGGTSSVAAVASIVVGGVILLASEVVIPKEWFFGFHPGLAAVVAASITYGALFKTKSYGKSIRAAAR
jgi:hypothetical protein